MDRLHGKYSYWHTWRNVPIASAKEEVTALAPRLAPLWRDGVVDTQICGEDATRDST